MRDHYLPASFLAIACLAVATATTYGALTTHVEHAHESMTIDAEQVTFYVNAESADSVVEPEAILLPETRIIAKRDPMAGPGKRCSQGAWFGSRPLEQGSGNVRGFCP